MSFTDWQNDIEQTFIQPLQDFRKMSNAFNEVHNDCMDQVGHIIDGLLTGSDGQTAFQGKGADALGNLIGQFLTSEQQYAGSSNYLIGRLADAATIYEKAAHDMQERLQAIASESGMSGFAEGAAGVAIGLDTGAAAQGGLDIPWDIIALTATGIAAIAAATNSPDQVRSHDAQQALAEAVLEVNANIRQGPDTEPLPPLPPKPQDNLIAFLKMLGIIAAIGIGGEVTYTLVSQLWPVDPQKRLSSLTPDELNQLKEYLAEQTGCSPDQIQNIINQITSEDPTGQQLKNLLDALKVLAQLQMLLSEVEASKNPAYQKFASDINGVIKTIDNMIKNGTWNNNELPTWVRTWNSNLNGFAIQWQAAQNLGAKALEYPMAGDSTQHADIIGPDNVWYEAKADTSITEGSRVYDKIVEQLYNYLHDPNYLALGGRGIGIVIPGPAMSNGTPWNIGTLLLKSLKQKYPNDPLVQRLHKIYVQRVDYTLPQPSSNRWCRMTPRKD